MNWPVILPVGLGFLSVLLLLPRPRPQLRSLGWLSALGALVTLISFLVGGFGNTQILRVEALLFYTFAGLASIFALLMITQRKPARAALCFASVVLNTCGLFLLQAAPFLMAATVIVYAGAIVVTFLFVIMLSQQAEDAHNDANDRSREPFLAPLAGFVMLAVLFVVLQRAYKPTELESLIARAEQAATASNLDELKAIVGKPTDFFDQLQRSFDRYRPEANSATLRDPHATAIRGQIEQLDGNIETLLFAVEADNPNLPALKTSFEDLSIRGKHVLAMINDPTVVAEGIKLSNYSRVVVPTDSNSFTKAANLPAANVSAIGRSLFSDHLLAIELGGTLLLVATIGAILIAGGRAEKKA